MAFPNPSITDIIATTIEFRSPTIADNMLSSNVLLAYLKAKGRAKSIDGGTSIIEPLTFVENPNGQWYSGADFLSLGASEDISGASYSFAQCAVPVVIVGLDKLKNAGKEKKLDLVETRLEVGEKTMQNLLGGAVHGDGTAFGGKQMTGMAAHVPTAVTTGTLGGINRATSTFWRPQLVAPGAGVITVSNINTYMNQMWVKTLRGKEHPHVILAGDNMWNLYQGFLQERQRFASNEKAGLGFPTLSYQQADVVLDGGITLGSGAKLDANTMLFLNLDYIFFRSHKDRNMVPLNPGRRYAVNQDVEAQILVWAGNMTASGQMFHGRLHNN